MSTQTSSRANDFAIAMLTVGILVFLAVLFGAYLISGVNHLLLSVWLYVPIPLGIINLVLGIRSKIIRKRTGVKIHVETANTNIVVGVLDLLLGLTPWVIYFFFFNWISP